MIRIFADSISMPSPTQPKSGDLFASIFGPIMPLVSDAWWIVLHLLLPICLALGVARIIFGGLVGSKRSMAAGQAAVIAVPLALILMAVSVLASNWIIANY